MDSLGNNVSGHFSPTFNYDDQLKYAKLLNELIDHVTVYTNKPQDFRDSFFNLPLDTTCFTTSTRGMIAASHIIEDRALALGDKPDPQTRFYVTFQKFSRMKPQIPRYRKLTASHIFVNVFGIADVPPWRNAYIRPIILPEGQGETKGLSKFWFVVLYNPNSVSMAILVRELMSGWPNRFSDRVTFRKYEGFWTYDNQIINRVVTILDNYISDYLSVGDGRVFKE